MTASNAKKKSDSKFNEYLGYARNGIKHFFKKENQMWLSFLLPALILLTSYFIFGVYPVGKQSVLSLDLNGQYIYYYDHMYDVLYGNESLFYSWGRNLSGEWMGIIGYYLASPFNFIVWLFPRTNILEGMLTMMCLKVGAIGLCMSIYLSRSKNFKKLTVIVFSVCYSLCAYTIVQTMNPMWLDGVMILPIICLAIERFVDQGRFRLLAFAWVYAFVTCFYIGFMLAIFSVIYYLFYMVITRSKSAKENFFKKSVYVLGIGVAAVMISAFMIIPVYESLSYGKFEFSTPDYSLKENFPFIELFDKILPNSYDTVRMTGLPFLYCGTITVLMIPAYFFNEKIRRSERISYAVLFFILFLSMYIRPVDMMWHGGQLPNWLPYRYSFIISFLMTVVAAAAFDRLKEVKTKTIGLTCLAWFAIMIYQENMDNFVEDLNNGRDTLNNFSTILPAMAIVLTVTVVLVQLRRNLNFDLRRNRTRVYSMVLLCIICSEALFNTVAQINTQHTDIVYSKRPTYIDYIPKLRDKVNEIKAQDDGFYRIEKLFFRTVNDPLGANMYGLSHSSSTLNAKPIELLQRLGFTARSHYTRYSGATLITSSLFGVKYELSTETNDVMDVRNGKEITVTKNDYALPICYLGEDAISELHLTEHDPFAAQTEMLNTLIGKNYEYYTRVTDYKFNPVNVTQGSTTDNHHSFKKIDANATATLTYTFDMEKSGKLYMYLPSTYERQINITVNGASKGVYFEGDNNYMRMLGEYQQGEKITLELKLNKENLYFREAEFAIGNEDTIKQGLTELLEINKDTVCTLPSVTHVKTEVNCQKSMTLLTTIPVEKGWKVFVDGKQTEYYETMDSLICVPLTSGKHTVEMKFTTAGYPLAIIISVAGVGLLVVLILLWLKNNPDDRKRRKQHLMTIYSGEASAELDKQREADFAERKLYREGKIEDEADLDEYAFLNDEKDDSLSTDFFKAGYSQKKSNDEEIINDTDKKKTDSDKQEDIGKSRKNNGESDDISKDENKDESNDAETKSNKDEE